MKYKVAKRNERKGERMGNYRERKFDRNAFVHIADVQLPIPDCKNVEHREQKHKFRVRAININGAGEILKGPWSDFGEGNCYNDGTFIILNNSDNILNHDNV